MPVLDNFIYHKEKALDHKTCENIITSFEKSNPTLNDHDYYGIYPDITDIKYNFLIPILQDCLKEYGERHKFLGTRLNQLWVDKEFHIQKYLVGTCYDQAYDPNYWLGHCEHGASHYDSRRLLGWMFYLNDIKKDGGTCFPQQNFTTKPREGDLYIWPAGWTHSHYGVPAPKEEKYIITGWCSWNKYP